MYLPLFASCRSILDIGCGPGLFLELLRGIDLDEAMVRRTREIGFEARCMRAQDLLPERDERSDGIYAGHVIERMAGSEMLQFLGTCRDRVPPAGVRLIRTPNWEHPYVRDVGFWLDVTHVRPYPAQLLQTVLSDMGFGLVKVLTEDAGLRDIAAIAVKTRGGLARGQV